MLVYNHEIRDPFATTLLPVPHPEGLTYDPGSAGGCTIVETDRDGNRVRRVRRRSPAPPRTARAAITPWGTWLTCEETEDRAGSDGRTKDHGYVFEVDPFDLRGQPGPAADQGARAVRARGRRGRPEARRHHTSPRTPRTPTACSTAGSRHGGSAARKGATARRSGRPTARFGAMRCTDAAGAHVDDLSRAIEVGTTYTVTWVPVPDRDARTTSTRNQFGPRRDHPRAQARGRLVGRRRRVRGDELRRARRARCRTTGRCGSTTRTAPPSP